MSNKVFCNFCDLEITNEKELGKLLVIQERQQFSINQTGKMPSDFKNIIERQEYDLCKNCLRKVFKAVEKNE